VGIDGIREPLGFPNYVLNVTHLTGVTRNTGRGNLKERAEA